MVKVKVRQNSIHVSGHADTAPRGRDVVCASITAITLTLIRGLEEIACMNLYESIEPGNVCIEWQGLTDTGKALIDTWFLGICGIADAHPVIEIE